MDNLKEKAIELYEIGFRICDITRIIAHEFSDPIGDNEYDSLYNKIQGYIRRYREAVKKSMSPTAYVDPDGQLTMFREPEQRVIVQNQEPEHYNQKWDGLKTIKFAVMGDTQFGSKYAQITHLHDFYDLCKRECITAVYHTGDITDGLKMRAGHEFELYAVSADDQLEDVVKNYPRRDGITTYFITGNHDASLYKLAGYDIGSAIARERKDMVYLGRDCAVVNITPNCTMELRHPWDGTAYAISYKIQKMIEGMESDSKPNILAVGHYHKAEQLFYRNVHALQTGCFQGQTPFTRGKGISVHLGGWIVTVHVDDEGTIQRFSAEFVPYYRSVTEDYRNYKK